VGAAALGELMYCYNNTITRIDLRQNEVDEKVRVVCTVLTIHCTHSALYSLCTVLTLHCGREGRLIGYTLIIHSSYSHHTLIILSSYTHHTLIIHSSYTHHTLIGRLRPIEGVGAEYQHAHYAAGGIQDGSGEQLHRATGLLPYSQDTL
jgi:hypothetical protein